MSLRVVPITLRAARRYIGEHHRHNLPPRGWKFGAAVMEGERLAGVGIASRPVARALDDGLTVEITRVCTDGTKNACSMLYGALSRAAFALGHTRVVTYTFATEPGTSLKAAGFRVDGSVAAHGGWDRPNMERHHAVTDLFGNERTPTEAKVRWVREAA